MQLIVDTLEPEKDTELNHMLWSNWLWTDSESLR